MKLLTVATILFAVSSGGSTAYAAECKELRLNGTNGWFPIIMRTDDGSTVEGLLPGVAADVTKRMNTPLKIEPEVPWKRLFAQLDRGDLDVVAGVYWTQERADKYIFSDPVLVDEVAIFVPKGKEFPLSSLDDLKGKVGARPFGGSYGQKFDEFAKANLDLREIKVRGENELIRLAADGKIDFAILGRYDGIKSAQEAGVADKVVDLEWPIASNDVYFLFSKESPCAAKVDDFNAGLKQAIAEGVVSDLVASYGLAK